MTDRIKYWVEMADYDFETAKAMHSTRRYLYVGFMCHQTIEKMLKAYWCKVREDIPIKIHSLVRLSEKCGLIDSLSEEYLDIMDSLEPLNIEARYPTYKERLMQSLNKERCEELIAETDKLRLWIKSKL